MLRIDCPFCGKRDYDEFSYEGDASVVYPAIDNKDQEAWYKAVFLRKNPKGPHKEYWYHGQGCRMFLEVERDTVTHVITKVNAAHDRYADAVRDETKKAKKS